MLCVYMPLGIGVPCPRLLLLGLHAFYKETDSEWYHLPHPFYILPQATLPNISQPTLRPRGEGPAQLPVPASCPSQPGEAGDSSSTWLPGPPLGDQDGTPGQAQPTWAVVGTWRDQEWKRNRMKHMLAFRVHRSGLTGFQVFSGRTLASVAASTVWAQGGHELGTATLTWQPPPWWPRVSSGTGGGPDLCKTPTWERVPQSLSSPRPPCCDAGARSEQHIAVSHW